MRYQDALPGCATIRALSDRLCLRDRAVHGSQWHGATDWNHSGLQQDCYCRTGENIGHQHWHKHSAFPTSQDDGARYEGANCKAGTRTAEAGPIILTRTTVSTRPAPGHSLPVVRTAEEKAEGQAYNDGRTALVSCSWPQLARSTIILTGIATRRQIETVPSMATTSAHIFCEPTSCLTQEAEEPWHDASDDAQKGCSGFPR